MMGVCCKLGQCVVSQKVLESVHAVAGLEEVAVVVRGMVTELLKLLCENGGVYPV